MYKILLGLLLLNSSAIYADFYCAPSIYCMNGTCQMSQDNEYWEQGYTFGQDGYYGFDHSNIFNTRGECDYVNNINQHVSIPSKNFNDVEPRLGQGTYWKKQDDIWQCYNYSCGFYEQSSKE